MIEVLGEMYYLDLTSLDNVVEVKQGSKPETDEEIVEGQQFSLIKYDVLKIMIEVIMSEREEMDNNLGVIKINKLSLPFKLAFNTLLKYNIIKTAY
jgi:hypothetical protein